MALKDLIIEGEEAELEGACEIVLHDFSAG